jgi:DNA-binding Lrp family transcriptional regulator
MSSCQQHRQHHTAVASPWRTLPRTFFSSAAFGKNRNSSMPTAIILLKIDHRKVTGTAEAILDIPGISEVYSISGRYDLLVIIKCESPDKIECLITDQLLKIEGIVDSETMFAFRSYDKREGGKAVDVD